VELPSEIVEKFRNLPETRKIYYEDAYIKQFESEVLGIEKLGDYTYIVLKDTAFYPEGGGQEGDHGILRSSTAEYKVIDTQIINERVVVHICEKVKGDFSVGDKVFGEIDWALRYNRMRHHTGSHIVFAATREVLGVKRLIYMGVHVGESWGRIDVNYDEPISDEQVLEIERLANKIVLENRPVKILYMNREEAEKIYGDKLGVTEVSPTGIVRVVEIEDWDAGLCGGTHVRSTAEVGIVRILERYKLAKGIQRIRFAVGFSAYEKISDLISKITEIARALNTSLDDVDIRVKDLISKNKELREKLSQMKKRISRYEAQDLIREAIEVDNLKIIIKKISEAELDYMQMLIRNIISTTPTAVVILGSITDKVYIVGGAGEEAIKAGVKINELIEEPKNIIEGKGGGSPRRIQLVGTRKEKLSEALSLFKEKLLRTK